MYTRGWTRWFDERKIEVFDRSRHSLLTRFGKMNGSIVLHLRNFQRSEALLFLLAVCSSASAAHGPRQYLGKPDSWFAGGDAKRIAANILEEQSSLGGWPKNIDTTAPATPGRHLQPTFDNRATTDELRDLARMFNATQDARYRKAFEQGVDYILQSQYPNGGWPQRYPPGSGYERYITFNDEAMVRLMQFVREISSADAYRFVDADRRAKARQAFDRGIDCILKCQIKVDGKLTAWCAQHDENDFTPRPARTFELVSLSGSESVGIVQLLMSLNDPSPQVVQSIESAIAWLESAKIHGIRQEIVKDEKSPKGTNKVVVKDDSAPPLWARFYEIGTNRPIFVDRDGIPKYDLAEIGYERRNGYGWLGDRPRQLLEKDYPVWRKKLKAAD